MSDLFRKFRKAEALPVKDQVLYKTFAKCLRTEAKVGKGDCSIMLEILRRRIEGTKIDLDNPGRFRSFAALEADMKSALGDPKRVHTPKWGATHVRGNWRDDDKRGNKKHLLEFAKLSNDFSGEADMLTAIYEQCLTMHHEFWESLSIQVEVQESDDAKARLLKLLRVPSHGRVQQGLVYAALKVRYGFNYSIESKGTFAGDQQSDKPGDVQVVSNDKLFLSVEVKNCRVDGLVWNRVEETHGRHDYPLFVLAASFDDGVWQTLAGRANTYPVHLADFLLCQLFEISVATNAAPREALAAVLKTYNEDFCELVEDDSSIRIELVEGDSERP